MKKRIVAMFLAVCFIVTLLPTAAFAANETKGSCGASGDNVTWELTQNDDDATKPTYTLTISGTGAMEDYENDHSAPWNWTKINITKIELNGNLTHIGDFAFYSNGFTSVKLPASVESVGKQAFRGCPNLKSVNFEDLTNLKTVGEQAFSGIKVDTLDLSHTQLTEIPKQAFQYAGMKTLVLPNAVTNIGEQAFNQCANLQSVSLQASLNTIGASAFSGCTALGTVDFTQAIELTSIGAQAFVGTAIESVDLSKCMKLTSFNSYTFGSSPDGNIKAIILPDGITKVITSAGGASHILKAICYIDGDANCDTVTALNGAKIGLVSITPYRACLNGGTFDADTEFEEGTLATPKKEGFKFNGWYKDADFSGDPVETVEAGNTYYAKYRKKARNGITIVNEEGARIGTLPNAEEDSTVKLPNTFDGIPGKVVSEWKVVEPQGLAIENNSFKMPVRNVTLCAILTDKPAEEEPGQTVSGADDGAATAAVILGGAAIGAVTYAVGTQIWMETHLPDGVIPTSREQLALMLWNAAGKPQPAEAALYADISAEAADTQLAARWCVEQGLMKDYGESFKPGKYTFRWQVIKAWNRVQKTN